MNKILLYVKKYWQVGVLVVVVLVGFFLFRSKTSDFSNRLKDINAAHDKEIKKINDARDEEKRKLQENERILKLALDEVKKNYESAKLELSKKKEKEIIRIVKEYGNNPVELAEQLSSSTGFKIILPESE